jgi:hypothetical protein
VGPTTQDTDSFSSRVRTFDRLEAAWRHVRANAIKSSSRDTRAELQEFEPRVVTALRSIQGKLGAGSFKFGKAKGIALGDKKRPIVIAPIESRIVQRAILDVVQEIPDVHRVLHSRFNFGGVDGPGFGVQAAIAKAVECAQRGGHYVRTDIRSFFVKVPRQKAADALSKYFAGDPRFTELFQAAIKTELQDNQGLDLSLFPLHEEGVAQGSCLSPLLCNFLLHDFDVEMNSRGITCIRYIDDFILFGKDRRSVLIALKKALTMLTDLGLSAYDPNRPDEAAKAHQGRADAGFQFLGCEVGPGRVAPSEDKRLELLQKVDSIFDACLRSARRPEKAIRSPGQALTFSGAILEASHVIRGWGNSYSFCSDDRLIASIDSQLTEKLLGFRKRYGDLIASEPSASKRRLLGMFTLADCNRDETPASARTRVLGWKAHVALNEPKQAVQRRA